VYKSSVPFPDPATCRRSVSSFLLRLWLIKNLHPFIGEILLPRSAGSEKGKLSVSSENGSHFNTTLLLQFINCIKFEFSEPKTPAQGQISSNQYYIENSDIQATC
jgi:hypothetical protein